MPKPETMRKDMDRNTTTVDLINEDAVWSDYKQDQMNASSLDRVATEYRDMKKAMLASKRSAFGNMMGNSRQDTSLNEYSADRMNSRSTFKDTKHEPGSLGSRMRPTKITQQSQRNSSSLSRKSVQSKGAKQSVENLKQNVITNQQPSQSFSDDQIMGNTFHASTDLPAITVDEPNFGAHSYDHPEDVDRQISVPFAAVSTRNSNEIINIARPFDT